jgi:hypothetical protein
MDKYGVDVIMNEWEIKTKIEYLEKIRNTTQDDEEYFDLSGAIRVLYYRLEDIKNPKPYRGFGGYSY